MKSDENRTAGAAGLSRRALDIVLALALGGWGLVVMIDSRRMGMGWSTDGPASGFFSFYIGAILTTASIAVIVRALASVATLKGDSEPGVNRKQIATALAVLIPTGLLIALLPYTGLYSAAAVYLLWFAKREAGFGWIASLALSLSCALVLFAIFTVAFDVPLPIGPIERWLGY
jgi:putative tricarboxylic transport membrane protein